MYTLTTVRYSIPYPDVHADHNLLHRLAGLCVVGQPRAPLEPLLFAVSTFVYANTKSALSASLFHKKINVLRHFSSSENLG
jgi:hypothetical protein